MYGSFYQIEESGIDKTFFLSKIVFWKDDLKKKN